MRSEIPLCGECGEVVNPQTFEGCKCKDAEQVLCVVCKRFCERSNTVLDSAGDRACVHCAEKS